MDCCSMKDCFFPVGCGNEVDTYTESTACDCHCHDMFYNYDTQSPYYVPNNTCHPWHCHCTPHPHVVHAPGVLKDVWCNFLGFTWYYGQIVTIELGFNPEHPFIYDDGTQSTFYEFLYNKAIKFTIYNFRMEEMASSIISPHQEMLRLSMEIDAKLSCDLIPGLYYLKVEAFDDKDNLIMINPTELLLLVKE